MRSKAPLSHPSYPSLVMVCFARRTRLSSGSLSWLHMLYFALSALDHEACRAPNFFPCARASASLRATVASVALCCCARCASIVQLRFVASAAMLCRRARRALPSCLSRSSFAAHAPVALVYRLRCARRARPSLPSRSSIASDAPVAPSRCA
jgi:hypothetical protein